jgi:hypothetical protein
MNIARIVAEEFIKALDRPGDQVITADYARVEDMRRAAVAACERVAAEMAEMAAKDFLATSLLQQSSYVVDALGEIKRGRDEVLSK